MLLRRLPGATGAYARAINAVPPSCGACGKPLEVAAPVRPGDDMVQIYNDLHIELSGGYGSFIDTDECVGGSSYEYVLCEACAMAVCRLLGLAAPVEEHRGSTVCSCPDKPKRPAARGSRR
jgi:hypothetical protein